MCDDQKKTTASRTERFELLFQTLESYNSRFVTAVVSVAGIQLAIIGWFLTSTEPRVFFGQSRLSVVCCIAILILLSGIYCYTILRVYRVNRTAYSMLIELNFIEETYFEPHGLSPQYKHIGLWLIVGIYLLIGVLIADAYWCFLPDIVVR